MHTHTHARREFKPLGLALELLLTIWESTNLAITLTAGPKICIYSCEGVISPNSI